MDKFNKLYNSALKFLSFRSRSEKEVREYLVKKVVDGEEVEEVEKIINLIIEKLKEHKFLDDNEFAKQWIESRMRFKPRSKKLLLLELKQKGISEELIESQISNFQFQMPNDLETAQKLVEKKIAKYKELSRQEIYQKLGGFLARKGFDWDTTKQAIDDILKKGV